MQSWPAIATTQLVTLADTLDNTLMSEIHSQFYYINQHGYQTIDLNQRKPGIWGCIELRIGWVADQRRDDDEAKIQRVMA